MTVNAGERDIEGGSHQAVHTEKQKEQMYIPKAATVGGFGELMTKELRGGRSVLERLEKGQKSFPGHPSSHCPPLGGLESNHFQWILFTLFGGLQLT